MVMPLVRLLVKSDSCIAVIHSFFPADELQGKTYIPPSEELAEIL